MKRSLAVAALLCAMVTIISIIPRSGRSTPDVVDGSTNPSPAVRMVSLAPSVTEMMFAMGLQASLVGVSDRCDYPPEAKRIECVGGFGNPNIEKLLDVKPDVVVGTGLARKDLPALLVQSRIRYVPLKLENCEGLFKSFRRLAGLTDQPGAAEKVVSKMRHALKAAEDRFRGLSREKRPRVYVEIWHDPIMTAGGPSFVDSLIRYAGGVNVAHEIQKPYTAVNPEQVLDWNPDVILLGYMHEGQNLSQRVASRIGWSDIAAVKSGRIISDIHPDLLLRPGPRLIEGVSALAERIHGRPQDRTQ